MGHLLPILSSYFLSSAFADAGLMMNCMNKSYVLFLSKSYKNNTMDNDATQNKVNPTWEEVKGSVMDFLQRLR